MGRPCSCSEAPCSGYVHPAELAGVDNPAAPGVAQVQPVDIGGDRYGGAYTPTGVAASSAPPPADPPAMLPQRPAMHPSGRRIYLVRQWHDFPLQTGNHHEVARVNTRPTSTQLPVEVRGSTLRAAPDTPDPTWAEAASRG